MKIGTLGLIIDGDHIWLARRKEKLGRGFLGGPGGKQEKGETLTECLIRETQKEWGITLDSTDLLQVARIVFHVEGKPSYEAHIFRATRFLGTPQETDDAGIPEKFPLSGLPLEEMFEGDRFWFSRAARGERFTAHVFYKQEARVLECDPKFFPPDF